MSKMGKTISITLPLPLVNELQNGADKVGISRSRFVSNLLLKWQDEKNKPESTSTKPNDCNNRAENGYCVAFDHMVCNAEQIEANTCAGYVQKKERH